MNWIEEPCPGCKEEATFEATDPDGTFCKECSEDLEERGIDPLWLVYELEVTD